jgi:hypothetical protein
MLERRTNLADRLRTFAPTVRIHSETKAAKNRQAQREHARRERLGLFLASISCTDRVCAVHGVVDYRSVDPVAKIVSQGVATFEYELIMSGTAAKIRLENGAVLSRTRTSLPRVSIYEGNINTISPVSERHNSRGATWQIKPP